MRHWVRRAVLAAGLTVLGAGAQAALFDDLGGQPGVQRIVDRAIPHLLADPRVGPTFSETNMDRFRRLLTEQLCQEAGGPCHYSGRSMAAAHRGLHLTQSQFNAVVEDMQDAMEEAGIPFATQNRLLARLAPQQRDMVAP